MAKRSSLTKILSEAAFYQAWFDKIPEIKPDPETHQRTLERYLKRFSKLPPLALKTVAKAASGGANRSIEAYRRLRPLPENVKAPIELPADPRALAQLIAKYRAKSR